ncbi:MAG: phenylalanyl-tRNA synthetase alpha chain, partial [Alphaproteobacteria bacterium]
MSLSPDIITALKNRLVDTINATTDEQSLETLRVTALGKKGEISELMKNLGKMSVDDKKTYGPLLNSLKQDIAAAIEDKKQILADLALEARLKTEHLDITLPCYPVA